MFRGLQKAIILTLVIFTGIAVSAQQHLKYLPEGTFDFYAFQDSMYQLRMSGKMSDQEFKHYKRWELANEPHVSPDGFLRNYPSRNERELKSFVRNYPEQIVDHRATHGAWEDLTPGDFSPNRPSQGRLNCIAVHPNDPSTIYAGAAAGGLWKTTNGGDSWFNLTDGLVSIGISGIVIHPLNPGILYILTGDGDGRNTPSMGVYKSLNSGLSWSETSLTWNRDQLVYGNKIVMDPNDPAKMMIATNNGLFITEDSWSTWTQKFSSTRFYDIDYLPGSSDTIFACTKQRVYRSVDSGESWQNLHALSLGLHTSDFSRTALAISPDSSGTTYALFARNTPPEDSTWGYHELYVTYDYGETWFLKNAANDTISNQCSYNLEIVVEPGAPDHVYVGAVNLWKSTDYGSTLEAIANGTGLPDIHADIHGMHFEGNTLYVATDGGMARSMDFGQSFSDISQDLSIMQFYDIAVQNGTYMGGTQDNGTNLWLHGDPVGSHIHGGDGFDCEFVPDSDSRYFSDQNRRWRWSTVLGKVDITPSTQVDALWAAGFDIHPTDTDTIYSGSLDMARSFNQGTSWSVIDTGFPSEKIITIVKQGTNDPNVMYISDRRRIRRTANLHDATPSWTDVTGSLLGEAFIGDIAVDPNDPDRVWAVFWGYNGTHKVWHTSTGGMGADAWINLSANLPNVPILSIAYQAGSNDGIYVGTDIGVFYKNGTMSDWVLFSNGLPRTPVRDLRIDDGYLYAGTYGRGLWRTELYTPCPYTLTLDQNNNPAQWANTGSRTYSAENAIISTRIINGGSGTEVTYRAGNYVRLDPGFEIAAGNEITVNTDGCPD